MWILAGSYDSDKLAGGITVFDFDENTRKMKLVGHAEKELQAGYLVSSPTKGMVYCVDERKTDGRGPVGPAASVHAFRFDCSTGKLTWKGAQNALGAYPTFLDLDANNGLLAAASHGSFEHIEHLVQGDEGKWEVQYLYDHSAIVVYTLDENGGIEGVSDVVVLEGHGLDPNSVKQAGGHAQSTAHAHCATIDPSGAFLIVCDKGTDAILVYHWGKKLKLASRFQFPQETAPRHVAFTAGGTRMYVTLELASELASMTFDINTGKLGLIDRVTVTARPVERGNEPAELRLHPNERFVYVNNRGEDSLAWFSIDAEGYLTREGHIRVADSIHPGLAARNFAFDPAGSTIFFADRPANCIRLLSVDPETGALTETDQTEVSQPAFVAIIECTEESP